MAEKELVACNGDQHSPFEGSIDPAMLDLGNILVPGPGIEIVILQSGAVRIVNTCEGTIEDEQQA